MLAWRDFATAERRTAWGLIAKGFWFTREPRFVKGQKPDFLTGGRGRMWVEVKEFDPPPSTALLNTGWELLTDRLEKFRGQCRIDAWISPGFNSRVAKYAAGMLAHEVRAGLPSNHALYIAVPSREFDAAVVSLEWTRRDGVPVRMVTKRSKDGKYACPPAADPASWTENVQLVDGSTETTARFFQMFETRPPSRIAMRVDTPDVQSLGYLSLGNSEVQDVKTIDKLRDTIERAKEQLKNAQQHREGPGLVVIFNDHLGGGDPRDVLCACLGDLTATFDRAANAIVETFHGRNGIFRPDKNTSVSAVVYKSRHYPSVSLQNPHAKYPINHSWLEGDVYSVDERGAVHRN